MFDSSMCITFWTLIATNILQVNPSDVIILEGILIFHDPRIRELMNMKIFVDTGYLVFQLSINFGITILSKQTKRTGVSYGALLLYKQWSTLICFLNHFITITCHSAHGMGVGHGLKSHWQQYFLPGDRWYVIYLIIWILIIMHLI